MSDTGPPFNGKEFRQFTHDFDFVYTTSSPHFHQSNGFIKAMVKKAKNAYKIMGPDPPNAQARALLQLCVTPITADLLSPAEDSYMVVPLKEQSFQDHPKESIYIRSGRDSLNFKKNRRNTSTKPTEPKIYVSSKSRNKSSSFTTNKAQGPHQVDNWYSD